MLKKIIVQNPDLLERIASKANTFEFTPGINLLVGRNGTGKSTLFDLILSGNRGMENGDLTAETDGAMSIKAMRMEDQSRNDSSRVRNGGAATDYYIYSHFMSHGQANWPIIQAFKGFSDNTLLLMDEPEQALDFHRMMELRLLLNKHSERLQFIIATHHPCLLAMPEANCVSVDQNPDYASWLIEEYRKIL